MFLLIARYPIQYDNCKIPYTYTYNNFHIPFHSSCIFHVYRVYGLPHMAHIDTHLFTLGRLRDLCRLVNQLSTPLHSPLPIPCFSPSPRSLHIFRQWIVHLHSSHALPKYFDSARTCQRGRGTGAWPALRLHNQNMENMCNVPHSHSNSHSVCGAPRVGGPTAHRQSFIVYRFITFASERIAKLFSA